MDLFGRSGEACNSEAAHVRTAYGVLEVWSGPRGGGHVIGSVRAQWRGVQL